MPYMAASATNPKLTDEGGASIYRLRGRDDQVAARIADDLANNWGDKPIAIIHDGQTYGRYLAETVRQQLHEHGIEEAAYEEVTPGQLEFSGLIESLQAVGVRVAFLFDKIPKGRSARAVRTGRPTRVMGEAWVWLTRRVGARETKRTRAAGPNQCVSHSAIVWSTAVL